MRIHANKTDALVVAAKGVLGGFPVVGPIVAELVGAIIPNQRIDRIARFVEELGKRVGEAERVVFEARIKAPEGVDLLEDAFFQSARALSPERIEYIASLLASGLTREQVKLSDQKFLLQILGQLSDAEIVLLASMDTSAPERQQTLREEHQELLRPKVAVLGSPGEEIDEATMHESRRRHLEVHGLLRTVLTPGHRERTEITSLGKLLLRTILSERGEEQEVNQI